MESVTTVYVPEQLSAAIARPRPHVEAVLVQSLRETGPDGRTALAWAWALTGSRPSPVALSLAPGRPPSRGEILAEANVAESKYRQIVNDLPGVIDVGQVALVRSFQLSPSSRSSTRHPAVLSMKRSSCS